MWTAGSFNPANYLPLTGGAITGGLSVNTLEITNTNALSHLAFSRASYNYVTAPASGIIGFITNGKGIGAAACDLILADTQVYAGTNNYASLGITANRWSNVYSVLGNFSSGVSVGGQLTASTSVATTVGFFIGEGAVGAAGGGGIGCESKLPPTAQGHQLGFVAFGSTNSTVNGYNGALIRVFADAAWTIGSNHSTYMTFETCPIGSATRVERMRIKSNGDVVINGNLTVAGEISAYGAGSTGLDTAPSSMTAAGTTGERRFCSDGIYVCIAANTWRKSTYTTF